MEKRGRGRPRVSEKIVGSSADLYESVITRGRNCHSRRSTTDIVYAFQAGSLLMEAASEIEGLDTICGEYYQCRSILNQLGRMLLIERYSEDDMITIAKSAIAARKDGCTVKQIERYIRRGRMTGEW